ncbi:hypothetical protein [Flavilitoribacter nigricans]|uniref:Uncharacterized protein n=1 Tax=Flavilitoribacter nigricans (strain ATCC 23147 / DSM 23189 / NBRC 102662 / NCIMB 1420 / SS-2) TaxID=1122177 RepID=A0A2D0NGE7_FLAN2|nr:hypothetical protein [Flavilitoribacter nigricans]PHN07547.1 hypothetical protein CRP01_05445 [Flavilitoribacter nigricans DSM 23189 = NBRC 102662]
MAFLTILLLLITVGGLGLLFTVLTKFSPGEKRIREELKRMQSDMDQWVDELVPIDRKELELFSLTQIKNSITKRFTTSGKGIYTTIFEEPIVAYSYKKYLGKNAHGLLYCRTAEHEYAYWIRPKGVQVVIDNKLVGTYNKENGVLYSAESKKMLARINREDKKIAPVVVGEREVASMVKALPAAKDDISTRAFQFVREDLTQEEEMLLLSVSLLEMVKETVGE